MSELGYALPLFPHDSVAITVTTTVWVGVCIVAFFNTRFGWTLSGLVVPGYLVPLLLVKPTAAAVIAAEAIVTYLAVHWLSHRLFPRLGWCGFFGRDRFLIIVSTSVLIRAVADGWLLPSAGAWCNAHLGTALDYHNDLHSFGLVMVALMANCLWKPGLRRGMVPLLVTVACTYAIVRFGFGQFTNFNVGNLQAMYDDASTSLLASPKAYMVVLLGAYIASSMNLAYGWEFNGILVPALLALQWHDPFKIAITFLEAFVIMALAKILLWLPFFQRTTIEGARKVAIFFTLCFFYRLALNHLIPYFLPEQQVTDLFGFGYLLSTLIAIRAYQHERKLQLIRAILQASMMGAVGGTAVGFGFTLLATPFTRSATVAESVTAQTFISDDSLLQVLQDHKLSLYRRTEQTHVSIADVQELATFQQALLCIYERQRQTVRSGTSSNGASAETSDVNSSAPLTDDIAAIRDSVFMNRAAQLLAGIGYQCSLVENRYLLLQEIPPIRGRGLYIFDLECVSPLVVEVPVPAHESGTIEAALRLFQQNRAAALAVASTAKFADSQGDDQVLNRHGTLFATFHRLPMHRDILQIRGYTANTLRRTVRQVAQRQSPLADTPAAKLAESQMSSLWVGGGLPEGLNLKSLQDAIGEYDVRWQPAPFANRLRDNSTSNVAELFLNQRDRRQLRAQISVGNTKTENRKPLLVHHESPDRWLLRQKPLIALHSTEQYVSGTVEEMLFLDQEVLEPICNVLSNSTSWLETSSEQREMLQSAALSAQMFGYELQVFHDEGTQRDYLTLSEALPQRRHWGTYVFCWTLSQPNIVEIPHPLLETNTFEFGVEAFRRLRSSAILTTGADPRTNADGSADVTRYRNRVNFYNLVRHVLCRVSGAEARLLVQARAIRAPLNADVFLAFDQGLLREDQLSPIQAELLTTLRRDGLTAKLFDGSPTTAGYEVPGFLSESALLLHRNKSLAIVWLSPGLRSLFRAQTEGDLLHEMASGVGIPTISQTLEAVVRAQALAPMPNDAWQEIKLRCQQFLASPDVVRLRGLQKVLSDSYRLTYVIDPTIGRAFLCVSHANGQLGGVVNLRAIDHSASVTLSAQVTSAEPVVATFVESRAAFLEVQP